MKLNPDCIRDILLCVEERSEDIDSTIPFSEVTLRALNLDHYSFPVVEYHLKQCELSGYLCGVKREPGLTRVQHLSPSGHQLLADIRSDTIWNHSKSVAAKIGAFSIDTLSKIVAGVITEMIKKQLA